MLSAIAKPFGLLMLWLYEWTGNYGIAVILFALIVKLILVPFQMKAKRSTLQQTRLQGKMKEIEKRHGANKQKYNEEIQKLYKEEGVSPMSGCIWSLIPFPILLALYQAIRYPITIMMGVSKDLLAEGGAIAEKLAELGFESTASSAYIQIEQSQFITAHWDSFSGLSDKLRQIDYSFLGLDLGQTPKFKMLFSSSTWTDKSTIAIACLAIIPVVAALLTWAQTYLSQKTQPKPFDAPEGEDATQKTMGAMNIMMPLMTLYFAFIMPAALGVYWIASSLFAAIQEVILNKYYGKVMAAEDAERKAAKEKKDREIEEKRLETERKKADNATQVNSNTSKKKMYLSEREEQRGKAAEWQRKKENRPAEEAAGRVEDRKYARGRAYDPDRYAKLAEEAEKETEEALTADEEPAEEAAAAEAEATPVEAPAAPAEEETVSDD